MTIQFKYDESNSNLLFNITREDFKVYSYQHQKNLLYEVIYCIQDESCQFRRTYNRSLSYYILDKGWKLYPYETGMNIVSLSWDDIINIVTLDVL